MNVLMLGIAAVLMWCAEDWKSFALGVFAGWLVI